MPVQCNAVAKAVAVRSTAQQRLFALVSLEGWPQVLREDCCDLSTMASSELLKQIQAGKKLKKAETLDRSAPIIEGSKSGGVGGGVGSNASKPAPAGSAGPPQLGGLFAGGMPKLKPAGGAGAPLSFMA